MGIFTRPSEPEGPSGYEPAKYNTPRALTASAARIDLKSTKEIEGIARRRMTDKWQAEAWDYYDLIGEIKFASSIISNVLSRINIYAAYIADPSQTPARITAIDHLDDDYKEKANSALYLLETGNGGTSGLLRTAAMNLFLVGECYLVREPAKWSTGEPEKWQIRSIDEIVSVPSRNRIPGVTPERTLAIKPRRDSKAADYIEIPDNGYISRMWRGHPRYSDEADSSMRGILDLCDALLLLNRTAMATAKSRLNAGMLFIPDGLSNVSQADESMVEDGLDGNVEEDAFEEELIDAMITPVSDPASASSVVPLLVRGPEELGSKIQHIKFERSFDPALVKQSETILNRIISGLDLPKEIVGGMANLKGANGKIVEETMYTSHIEPMILMICDCLTVAFLRPALRALGYPEEHVMRTVVWYDPSAITSKPSKAESATIGFDKQVISGDAWRRAHGFSVSDAPTQLEIAQRLAVAKGLISEPLAEKLISTLIPDLMSDLRKEQLQQSDPSSAAALNSALDGGAPTPPPAADGTETSDTIDSSSPTPPPTLLEP